MKTMGGNALAYGHDCAYHVSFEQPRDCCDIYSIVTLFANHLGPGWLLHPPASCFERRIGVTYTKRLCAGRRTTLSAASSFSHDIDLSNVTPYFSNSWQAGVRAEMLPIP